ncbi:MAG TPA: TetR family transcriptional regulator [Polyangiaceae bacterium]|jgi:TetR/AcrR family transcriptional repressor of bet genes
MGRPSLRAERRTELARAFARVLGTHGRGGATVAAAAAEAGMAPGLVHHYFATKEDLYEEVLDELVRGFRRRVEARGGDDRLEAYVDAALALDDRSDVIGARAWVGLFAEAVSDPALFTKVRRRLDAEVAYVEGRARGTLSTVEASAVVAFVVGALVFGAFAPRKAAGFAAPGLRALLAGFRRAGRV